MEEAIRNENEVLVKGVCEAVVYYRENSFGKEGGYGVYDFGVSELLLGSLPRDVGTPPFCRIKCVGNTLSALFEGSRYELRLSRVVDPKYGPQFRIEDMAELASNVEEEMYWSYLRSQLTERQYELLASARYSFDFDVLKAVKQGDLDKLCTIKGIKTKTAVRIVDAYRRGEKTLELTATLAELGFSAAARASIMKQYPHEIELRKLCAELQSNFYAAIGKVRGFSWLKVDKIAREHHGYREDCKERIQAYVLYFFDATADDQGHSWVPKDELIGAIFDIAPNIEPKRVGEYLADMLNQGLLYYDRETKRIGSQVLYNVEKDTAEQIARLMEAPNWELKNLEECIKWCESVRGYEYTSEQKEIMHAISDSKVTLVTGVAGCVDADTEFFTGSGWKRIADWEQGDKVLQYNKDGTAELVVPERYIKTPADTLWLIEAPHGTNMCVSDDHFVPYIHPWSGELQNIQFKDLKEAHEKLKSGFCGKFIHAFHYDGPGLPLTDWEIKMMCAVICDGSFHSQCLTTTWCRFHIKKERKKIRLRELFAEGGVEYKERQSAAPGYSDFYFHAPMRTKTFSKEWYRASQHQLQLICDNILFWDGWTDYVTKSFSANNLENATFVQFAFAACGRRATLCQLDRRGQFKGNSKYSRKSIDYNVFINKRTHSSLGGGKGKKIPITPYHTIDGYQYCFTVPTHMWVSRRKGRITVQMNSGKSNSMYPITEALKRNHKAFAICALSGKASLNIGEATDSIDHSYTIHRLLGYRKDDEDTSEDTAFIDTTEVDKRLSGGGIFPRDPITNKLVIDLLIIDEVSMIGGYLFRRVVEALPDNAKLVLVGDEGQLEAIGYANILWDIKRSGVVPYYTLTKIMRQAARSGILSDSLKIYRKEQFIPADLARPAVHGELQDFKIIPREDSKNIQLAVQEEYQHFLAQGISTEDIIVVTQKRVNGALASNTLNNIIQDIANPKRDQNYIKFAYSDNGSSREIEYRQHDRVMMTANDYNVPFAYELGTTEVFNGNMGVVLEAGGTAKAPYLIIKFPQGICRFSRGLISKLQLGYAATCHKLQGSGIPYVIGVVDPSAITLLTNEAIYTEITRAKKYCVLIGSPHTIRAAVRRSDVKKKQTWLAELLQERIGL